MTDRVDGLLVPPQDVQALGDAINEMIEDGDLRRRCAAQAVLSAQRFDLDAVSDQWLRLFTELLHHQPAPSFGQP